MNLFLLLPMYHSMSIKKSVTEVKKKTKCVLEKYILFSGISIFCVNDNDQIINWPKCVETEHNFCECNN